MHVSNDFCHTECSIFGTRLIGYKASIERVAREARRNFTLSHRFLKTLGLGVLLIEGWICFNNFLSHII